MTALGKAQGSHKKIRTEGPNLDNLKRENLVRKYLEPGDVVLVVGLLGEIEEHVFTGYDGVLICGNPTRDGIARTGRTDPVSNVAARNVLRINAVAVDVLEFVAPKPRV